MDWSRSARNSKALLASAAMGGAITTLTLATLSKAGWGPYSLCLAVFGLVSMFFFVGILIVGVPAWLLLSRFGRRNWYDAMLLGGASAFIAAFAWGVNFDPGLRAALFAAPVGVAGAAAGLTGWWMLYRERPSTPRAGLGR